MKRQCPLCKGPLMLLMSYRRKACYDCRSWFNWELDENQKPLVVHQR